MKILIAGGAGYVGSILSPALAERGHAVTVVDELWFGNHLPADIAIIKTELFSLNAAALAGYDRVIFIAGLSNDPMAEFDPALNFIQNAALPAYLAYEAKRAGVRRFVYGSSCSVYGFTGDQLCTEESPVNCPYPYGISKWQGEQGVMHLVDDTYSAIALRQGTVNGHSPRMRFDLVVNTMFRSALTDGRITVNHPDIWRPLLDIRDTVQGFIRAVEIDDAVSGVFNVAYANYTIGDIAETIQKTLADLGCGGVAVESKNVADCRNYKVDCEKARRILGFSPRHDIAAMVRSLYEHRQEYGDFSAEAFYNIRVFRRLRGAS